jgi:chorismate mutase
LSESYLDAKAQAEGFLDTITETINSAEGEDFKKLLGFSPEQVDSLKEYNTNINKMVETLAKAKGITEAEARSIIEASDAFSQFANAGARIDIMAQDLDVKDGEKNNLNSIKNNLQNIYDGLSEEDKTLFLTLDIANIDPNKLNESINKALAEAREKAIIAEAKLEAKELGFDESAFESYADILQDTNKHLEGNKGKAYKVGLQNARLSKGLVTLTESFKDNVSILAKGNRESYEYAEAIGALKDSFEEMYGYKPSTVFIEGHLEEI